MLTEKQINKIQAKIGYTFSNPALLSQAFTRRSWAVAEGEKDNEILEFFGDRILDFTVVRDFCEQYGRIDCKGEYSFGRTVGEISKMDVAIVKNANLAEKIDALGLGKYLQAESFVEKRKLKSKADLFEAILGAVAMDCDWNFPKIRQVFYKMMYGHYICDSDEINANSIGITRAEDWIDFFNTEIWKFDILKTKNVYESIETGSLCQFYIILNGKSCLVTGVGKNEQESMIKACECGYRIIKMVLSKEVFEDIRYIDQVYLLRNCGYLCNFDIHFELYPHVSRGENDLWRCFGTLKDLEVEFVAEDSSMGEARESVAYAILSEVLGIEEFEENQTEQTHEIHGQGLLKLILSRYNIAV